LYHFIYLCCGCFHLNELKFRPHDKHVFALTIICDRPNGNVPLDGQPARTYCFTNSVYQLVAHLLACHMHMWNIATLELLLKYHLHLCTLMLGFLSRKLYFWFCKQSRSFLKMLSILTENKFLMARKVW